MSTRTPSPEASFLREFEEQVSCQKQMIHCQRKESLKENSRKEVENRSAVLDIVDWVEMRAPQKSLLSDTIF